MKTAHSATIPKKLIESEGKIHFTFNVTGVPGGYTYNYVEIEPPITQDKIYRARRALDAEITESDADAINAEFELIEARLNEIEAMSWAQVDTHIDTVFSALTAGQKTSLKKLYKAVLALIKIR